MTHPVNWFSISGTDGQALMSFYKKVFGWQMDMMPGAEASGMVKPEAGGIPGDVSRSMNGGNQVTVYIGVGDIDAHMKKIQKAGGNPAMPKTALPAGFGWIAQFTDPAGNAVGLWQPGEAMAAQAGEAPAASPAPARRAKKPKPAKAAAPAMEEPKPAPAKKAAKAPKAAAKPAKPVKAAKPAAKSAKPAAKPAKSAKSAKPAAKPAKAAAKAVKAAAAAKPAKPAKGAAKAKPKAKGRKA